MRGNRYLDYTAYLALRLFYAIVHMFPIDMNLRTARLLGYLWYRLSRRHRERALGNLRRSIGQEASEAQLQAMALRSMQQMAMMAMEVLFEPRLISEWTWPRYIRLRNLNEALRALLRYRGCIMLTGHYGNWELVGFTLAALGFDMVAVMRPLDNPYLNDWLVKIRENRGLRLLYKKGVARSADEVLESGAALCFIADQNAGRKGLFVDFFGRPASTYKSIGLLAMRHRVPIVIGCARRLSDRFQYEIDVNRVIYPEEWAQHDDELRWITQEYTRAIEEFIRVDPGQYLWVHRRWKTRPKGEMAEIA
ncbi:MAG: lysophospholipid acyltransferase family protein [Phycisphaerae bacterium]|nr:lysophospholipid acyltransferase family protein [Phycisphaerae bacterium]